MTAAVEGDKGKEEQSIATSAEMLCSSLLGAFLMALFNMCIHSAAECSKKYGGFFVLYILWVSNISRSTSWVCVFVHIVTVVVCYLPRVRRKLTENNQMSRVKECGIKFIALGTFFGRKVFFYRKAQVTASKSTSCGEMSECLLMAPFNHPATVMEVLPGSLAQVHSFDNLTLSGEIMEVLWDETIGRFPVSDRSALTTQ